MTEYTILSTNTRRYLENAARRYGEMMNSHAADLLLIAVNHVLEQDTYFRSVLRSPSPLATAAPDPVHPSSSGSGANLQEMCCD